MTGSVADDKEAIGNHEPITAFAGATQATITYASDMLFRGKREIIIQHDGAFYRLRITRQGKLILNK